MRLLLLPGMDGTGRLFAPFLEALPQAWEAQVVTYPNDRPLGYDELLPIVEEAAAGFGKFVVIGESFSGPLAVMLAERKQQSVRGVVLAASFIRKPWPAPLGWMIGLARGWMFRLRPPWIVVSALLGSHGGTDLKALVHDVVRLGRPEILAARARAIATVDVTDDLRACQVPILYLQGTHDRVVGPRNWKMIKSVRPDAELAKFPAPHLILQTQPESVVRALTSFGAQL